MLLSIAQKLHTGQTVESKHSNWVASSPGYPDNVILSPKSAEHSYYYMTFFFFLGNPMSLDCLKTFATEYYRI